MMNPDDDYAETLVLPNDELATRRHEILDPAPMLSLPQVRRLLEAAARRQAARRDEPPADASVVALVRPGEPRQ